eukprot:SAG11_NODE_4532_length_1862_cov_1.564379_3_plen_114_part_00
MGTGAGSVSCLLPETTCLVSVHSSHEGQQRDLCCDRRGGDWVFVNNETGETSEKAPQEWVDAHSARNSSMYREVAVQTEGTDEFDSALGGRLSGFKVRVSLTQLTCLHRSRTV